MKATTLLHGQGQSLWLDNITRQMDVHFRTTPALVKDPGLADFSGRVSDSGEGRWTINAAIDESVPVPVLSAALSQRFSSRGESQFADRVLSGMRYEFGGHREMAAGGEGRSR